MYIKRHLEKTIKKYKDNFPVVLVTGPRQVGKSTVFKNLYPDVKYVTLDDPYILSVINSDPLGYLKSMPTPLILDEIQRAPNSFLTLKYMVDQDRKYGMYLLTGSQKFQLMKGVSDSLAGRIGIIDMLGLSNREIYNDDFNIPFLPNSEYLNNRQTKINFTNSQLWGRIHRGSMPELYNNPNLDWEQYYSSYIATYIDRDINQIANITNKLAFTQFLTALASRTGELLNLSSIANDVGIDSKTAKNWLSILEASNIVFLLQPFSLNINKRVIKTPKVYFNDTGLVCYLCRWLTPEVLEKGAMAGAIYETFVINEIIKSYINAGKTLNLYYFRNTDAQEVDLLIYQDGCLYPIEIKKTASPNIKDIKHFKVLENFFPTLKIAEGGVICNYTELAYLNENNKIIPINYV